jgi:tetratricopeptide (TPR) repeat protein
LRLARVFFVFGVSISACFLGSIGCSHKDASPTTAPSSSASAAANVPDASALIDHVAHTTAPQIAIGNLNADLAMREKQMAHATPSPDDVGRYIDLLLAHSQFAGKVSDLEKADQVTVAALPRNVGNGTVHLARANVLGAVHKFDQALAELVLAEKAGVEPLRVAEARAAIFQAVGRFDDAAAIRNAEDENLLPVTALAARAELAGEMQKFDESERLFTEARVKYHDVSPFPLAWMDFQRGSLLERRGDRDGAKKYFAEANQILPTYTHASVHLAALETPERAVVILTPLVDATDDADVLAGMADALRRSGKTADATAMQGRAKARYEELLAKYPEAFADHAATFFLGPNGDVQRALTLAIANEKLRKTEPSIELLITPAMASNSKDVTCIAVRDGAALKYASTAFRANIAPLFAGCGIDAGVK